MTVVLDRPVETEIHTEELSQEQKDLLAAADYIEEHGWIQHTYGYRKGGPACLVGAINFAIFGQVDSAYLTTDERIDRVLGVLRLIQARYGITNVIEWNDTEASSAEEVINVLRSSAL